jgi:hypothetical protein
MGHAAPFPRRLATGPRPWTALTGELERELLRASCHRRLQKKDARDHDTSLDSALVPRVANDLDDSSLDIRAH